MDLFRQTGLLRLDDGLLRQIGTHLVPNLDIGPPSYGCLGVNQRLRELWRPFVCSRLRLLSAQPADSWLIPAVLRFVSISDAVQELEIAFSSTGFAREMAAVSMFRNLRSLSIDFQREQANTPAPEAFVTQLKALFAHLPALRHLTLIEPTLVVTDIASLISPMVIVRLRSLRLEVRHRTTGRITSLPSARNLELHIGGSKDDIPAELPWQGLDSLRIDSDAMENAALCELRDQLKRLRIVRDDEAYRMPGQLAGFPARIPLEHLSITSSSYESKTRQHNAARWFTICILKHLVNSNLVSLELKVKVLHDLVIDILPATNIRSLRELTLDLDCTLFNTAYFEQMPGFLRLFPNLHRLILKSHDTRCTTAEALVRVQLSRFQLSRQHRNVSDLLSLLKETKVLDFRSWHSVRGDSHVRWTRRMPQENFTSEVWYALTEG
ncbi:hypothetical protein JCM10908_006351 [Rhodotorula pacifica]|uniref:uncharacterized protein n=1 Tax=Rhodotorula pacifica TaxID=1495444 RepID=UPI00317D675A